MLTSVLTLFRSFGDANYKFSLARQKKTTDSLTAREQNIVEFHKGIKFLLKTLSPVLCTAN